MAGSHEVRGSIPLGSTKTYRAPTSVGARFCIPRRESSPARGEQLPGLFAAKCFGW